MKKVYYVVEVITEAGPNVRGEEIVRTKQYDSKQEAEQRMATMMPKENGTLKIRVGFVW